MSNRYLDGITFRGTPPRIAFGLPLWFGLSAIFIALFLDGPTWVVLIGGAVTLVAVVSLVRASRPGREVTDGLQKANLDRLRGRIDAAVERLRALLGRRLAPGVRATLLYALGECAEASGAFAEAADVYARGEGLLRSGRRTIAHNQLLPMFGARRAFCLAACGLLEPADAALRSSDHKDGLPQASALASRAALLIATKRGLFADVEARVAGERALHRNAFGARDRAFTRVAAAIAHARLHGQGARAPVADVELRDWMARAFGPELLHGVVLE
jgi:hypothetical protein